MAWTDTANVDHEEKLLWACVLRRAVYDYVLYKGVGKHKMKWQQANRFLFGDGDDSYSVLSFEEICGLFGWEPEYLRRITRRLDRSDIKKLETSAFREYFDSSNPDILSPPVKWALGCVVPSLLPANIGREYREQLRLRRVRPTCRVPLMKDRPKSIPPVRTRWSLMA